MQMDAPVAVDASSDAARTWKTAWLGDMPYFSGALKLDTTLVSVGGYAIHERAIVSPQGFGERIETQLSTAGLSSPLVADLDGEPGLDVAVVVGAPGNHRIDVFRNVGLSFAAAATLPAASGENIRALAAVGSGLAPPKLVALVETSQGRRLRVYPGQAQAAYTAASASEYSDALLDRLEPYIAWAGDYERIYVATLDEVWYIQLSNTGIAATQKIADLQARTLVTHGNAPSYLLISASTGAYVYDRAAMQLSLINAQPPTSTIGVLDTGYVYASSTTLVAPPPYPSTTLPFAPSIVRGFRRADAAPSDPYSLLLGHTEQAFELMLE